MEMIRFVCGSEVFDKRDVTVWQGFNI